MDAGLCGVRHRVIAKRVHAPQLLL